MPAIDNIWLQDIALKRSVREIDGLLETGILHAEHAGHPLFRAAVINVLICLNDMLQRASKAGLRVGFSDDISFVVGEPFDVTTLINDCRGAACHMASANIAAEGGALHWNISVGPCNAMVTINGRDLGACPYEGEVLINLGQLELLLERHLLRAFREARTALGI